MNEISVNFEFIKERIADIGKLRELNDQIEELNSGGKKNE